MGIVTKGIKGILKVSKKTLLTKKGYEDFLSTLSRKNGVDYFLLSEKELSSIQKVLSYIEDQDTPYNIEKIFYRSNQKEFDLSEVEEALRQGLKKKSEDLHARVEELVGLNEKGKLTDKELKKELLNLKKETREQKKKYVMKIEEIQETQDGNTWNEHSSSKTIFGTPRSSWNLGCSYNTRKKLMLFVGKQGNTIDQWLIPNVPYAKWIVLRDYQGFVPYNGIGTYTIRNIKKKKEWKKI